MDKCTGNSPFNASTIKIKIKRTIKEQLDPHQMVIMPQLKLSFLERHTTVVKIGKDLQIFAINTGQLTILNENK